MAEQGHFDEHHLEIGRRREATHAHVPHRGSSTFAPNADDSGGTFAMPDQNVVLMSISHRAFPPLSLDGLGALRLYGAFPDDAEAVGFAPVIAAEDPGVSMVKYAMREWMVVASSPARFGDEAAMAAKREGILAMHDRLIADDAQDFQERYDKRGEEDAGRTATDMKLEDWDDVDDAVDERAPDHTIPDGGKACRKRMSAQTQLAGQRCAVVSLLVPPDDPEGEFLLKVYACFDTPQEADAWVRNQASAIVQRENLDVVKLHEWFKPATMSSANAPREEYRDGELNNIMRHHKEEPRRVQDYKQWLKDNPEAVLEHATATQAVDGASAP